jgi:hypothetical protein
MPRSGSGCQGSGLGRGDDFAADPDGNIRERRVALGHAERMLGDAGETRAAGNLHLKVLCKDQWNVLAEFKGNYHRRRIHHFETVNTRKLLLEVYASNGDPTARVYEMRVYKYLVQDAHQDLPNWFGELASATDCSAAITKRALEGSDHLCEEALRLFVSLYGAEAGNLALKVMARGGVYMAGGIAPKMPKVIHDGTFLEGFCCKGRMRGLMEGIPLYVVLNEACPLIGAAAFAARANAAQG